MMIMRHGLRRPRELIGRRPSGALSLRARFSAASTVERTEDKQPGVRGRAIDLSNSSLQVLVLVRVAGDGESDEVRGHGALDVVSAKSLSDSPADPEVRIEETACFEHGGRDHLRGALPAEAQGQPGVRRPRQSLTGHPTLALVLSHYFRKD